MTDQQESIENALAFIVTVILLVMLFLAALALVT